MNILKFTLTVTIVIAMSYSFSAFSQPTGAIVYPPELAGKSFSSNFIDSIGVGFTDYANPALFVNQDSLGNIIWYGVGVTGFKYDENKIKSIHFICTEDYWLKSEIQFDTLTRTMDYMISTTSADSTGSEFWTESINVEVTDNTEIVINSPVDVTGKMYEAYDFYNPTITQLSVIGNGINQSFQVDLKSNVPYIIAFVDNNDSIVSIKRIGG